MAGEITVHSDLLCRQMQQILPLKELTTSTDDGFPVSSMGVRVGPQRSLSTEERMLLNCGAREDYLEFFGQQGDQTSQS